MRIQVSKRGKHFIVDPVDQPGSPAVGVGRTLKEAFGEFLIAQQKALGITEIVIDPSAQSAENNRRRKALEQR